MSDLSPELGGPSVAIVPTLDAPAAQDLANAGRGAWQVATDGELLAALEAGLHVDPFLMNYLKESRPAVVLASLDRHEARGGYVGAPARLFRARLGVHGQLAGRADLMATWARNASDGAIVLERQACGALLAIVDAGALAELLASYETLIDAACQGAA